MTILGKSVILNRFMVDDLNHYSLVRHQMWHQETIILTLKKAPTKLVNLQDSIRQFVDT